MLINNLFQNLETMNWNINNLQISKIAMSFFTLAALALAPSAVTGQDEANKKSDVDENKINSRIAIGLRASHLYDLKVTSQDLLERGVAGNDVWGLNGDNTKLDFAFGLDLTYFFSPFFSLDFAYDIGSMTAANELEYSQTDVSFYNLGANFNLKRAGLKEYFTWVPYARISAGIAQYDATRFMAGDDLPFNSTSGNAMNVGLGLGIRYHINNNLHLNLASEFRTVFNDGFDGYDYGTGRDQMLQTTLGIRYTFGKGKHVDLKPAWRDPSAEDMVTKANRKLKDYNDTIQAFKQGLIKLEDLTADEINQLKSKQAEHSDDIDALKNAKTTTSSGGSAGVQAYTIFFGFNQWSLSDEHKKNLMPVVAILKAEPNAKVYLNGFTDRIGSDNANAKVRQNRLETVKSFLANQGIDESRMLISDPVQEYSKDAFLDRRVDMVIK